MPKTTIQSLGTDLLQVVTRISPYIGGILFICSRLINGGGNYFYSDVFARKLFWLLDALAHLFFWFGLRDKHWFFQVLFGYAIYNLLDEIQGTACIWNWNEIWMALISLIVVYGIDYYKGSSNGK